MPVRSFTETLNEIRWDIFDTNVIARDGGDRADKVGVEGGLPWVLGPTTKITKQEWVGWEAR